MGKTLPKLTKHYWTVTWKGLSLQEMSERQIKSIRQRILEAWDMAFPDEMVLRHACITKEQYDVILEKFPEFAAMRETLYVTPRMKARKNILDDIDKGNVSTSKWLLERTDPEFSKKGESTVINVSVREREEAILKEMRKFGTADFTVVEEDGEPSPLDEGEDTGLQALQEDNDK